MSIAAQEQGVVAQVASQTLDKDVVACRLCRSICEDLKVTDEGGWCKSERCKDTCDSRCSEYADLTGRYGVNSLIE
jgi:hypothetical protein